MSRKIAIAIVVAISLMVAFVVLATNVNLVPKSLGETKAIYVE